MKGERMSQIIYYSLRECEMSRDQLERRLSQWWRNCNDDPWVQHRATLIARSWPYYTLDEMEMLADLLLYEEERNVLKESSIRPEQHVRMSLHAYRCFERAVLSLTRLRRTATLPAPTTFIFANFPGERTRGQGQGEVTLVFPDDLRLVRRDNMTFYASLRDELVMKASEQRRTFLVRGQERVAILELARRLPPWVLVGTPREVQMEVPQEGASE
jgi:hypothetical protein